MTCSCLTYARTVYLVKLEEAVSARYHMPHTVSANPHNHLTHPEMQAPGVRELTQSLSWWEAGL